MISKTRADNLGFCKERQNIDQAILEALESAEHGVWYWEVKKDSVYYSPQYERQLGYNGDEFSPTFSEFSSRLHPDDREPTLQVVNDYLAKKTSQYRTEFRMRTKEGDYIWILSIGKAVWDENNEVIRLSGTHTVITKKKELEIELQRQRSFLNSLIRCFPDLVWLKDPDGEYLAVNNRFEDFFGHLSSEIIGKTDYDFVRAELADFFRIRDQVAIDEGTAVVNEETIEFAVDGHKEVLETIKTPVFDDDGKLIGVLGVGRDISAHKKAQQELALAASVFRNSHDSILICNADVEIIDINPGFIHRFGYSREELIGKNPRIIASGKHNKAFYKDMWYQVNTKGQWYGEIWNKHKNGKTFPLLQSITAVRNKEGNLTHYLSILSDISKIKSQQAELEYLAHYDSLTGLPNRVLLADCLTSEIKRAETNNTILAVGFIDLDNFKKVNDVLGHAAGDKVLQKLSTKLMKFLRKQDLLSRIGGDEFILLLSGDDSIGAVCELAERILRLLTEPIKLKGKKFNLTASMGITLYPNDHSDPDTLIRHADQAMYQAKLMGKNQFCFFDVEANQAIKLQTKLIGEISEGLRENQFILYYQPKLDIKLRKIVGFEALIRWQHPERGLVYPDEFLPAIEKQGILIDIDEWVVEQACRQLIAWHQQSKDFSLSINISSEGLLSEDFINKLECKLAYLHQICTNQLEVEVLETSNFSEIEIAQRHLLRLKETGMGISLDDFGTGTSSLSFLRTLPVDTVKIDKSFIMDILDDKNDLAIVDGIIQLAKGFDLKVIAEGVETQEHAVKLCELECRILQGYWIAKPMHPNQIDEFVRNWRFPKAVGNCC